MKNTEFIVDSVAIIVGVALDQQDKAYEVGSVSHDHRINVLRSWIWFDRRGFSPQLAEFQSDCLGSKLMVSTIDFSMLEDILSRFVYFENIEFSFIPRFCNTLAHHLAKIVIESM